MKVTFKIVHSLLSAVHADLSRAHPFALERVGFLACRPAAIPGGQLLLANEYFPVADEDYEDDPRFGAMMAASAIRKALQHAYRENVSMIHVHRHEHRGRPRFSKEDVQENAKFVPDFFKVRPKLPHGAIVLSQDAMFGEVWEPGTLRRRDFDQLTAVGRPLFNFWR